MFQRCIALISFVIAVFGGISTVMAGDWTISQGGTYPINEQLNGAGADLKEGDGIIIDGATDTANVIIQINSAGVPALGKGSKAAISITNTVNVTIQLSNDLALGSGDSTSLLISGSGGSLTATGAGYFDFSANTNKTLSIQGAVANGKFRIRNNEVHLQGPFVGSIGEIILGGNAAGLTSTVTATVGNINLVGNATFNIEDGTNLNLANPLNLNGYAASLIGRGTISAVTMNTSGSSIVVPINAQSPASIGTLTMQEDGIINVASGKQLTTTNPIYVEDYTLTMAGAGTISDVILNRYFSYLYVLASGTITNLGIEADALIYLEANLTVTNAWYIGANTLTLWGYGKLNRIGFNNDLSKLEVYGSPTITTVNFTAVNSEIYVDYGDTLTVTNGVSIPANKTLTLSGEGTVSDVLQTNAGTILKVTNNARVGRLYTGFEDFTIDVDTGRTLTLGSAVSVGPNMLTLAGSGTVSAVSLDDNASILTSLGAATPIITTLNVSANGRVKLLDGKKITVTNPFTIGSNTFTIEGSKGGGQDSFAATIRLNHINSTLVIDCTDVDNIKDFTVSIEVDGIILVFNNNSSPTAINMLNGRGDLDLIVGLNKTLTTVVDVNQNVLALKGPGKVKTIRLDEEGGQINIHANASNKIALVEKIQHSAKSLISFRDDGTTLSVTDAIEVGGNVLEIAGSGGGTIEYVNGTIKLQKAASILKFSGKDEDDLSGSTIVVEAKGATINTVVDINPVAINMSTDNGDLNLYITANKYVDAPVTVNNNTLTLWDKGTVASIEMNRNGGALTVRENVTVDNINLGGKVSINVSPQKTLTTDLNLGSLELTLTGTGTISKVISTTGKIIANTAAIINELAVSPGTNQTFTWAGTGSATVKVLTPLNENNESFTKTGTGSLRVNSGFSFGGANGIKLLVNEGTFIDAGGASVVFGDNEEKIIVANGATFTTSSSFTGNSGPAVNLDAVAGSTVNFAKSGEQTLFAAADDDFRMLGTVNIENNAVVYLTGACRYQFGNVNVRTSGELANNIPGSTMLFAPDSMITLEGTGSGAFRVNGQSAAGLITMNTTTGTGKFTFNRRRSDKVTFQYVDLTNCTYTSLDGGLAVDEMDLVGVVDNGNNVNWFSNLSVNAGSDKTILSGDSVTLQPSVYGASGSYTYLWSPATGLDDPTLRNPKASPLTTQEYTLTVTDTVDTSIFASDSVTITVLPQLIVNAGPDKTVVQGTAIQLQGSASGGSGQYIYEWVPDKYLSDPASPMPTCTPLQSLTYTLSVTDTVVNKTVSDSVTITVSQNGGDGTGGFCGMIGGTSLMLTFMGLVGLRHTRRRW